MISPEIIEKYYQNLDLTEIDQDLIKFRHIRINNSAGHFVKFPIHTSNLDKLQEFFIDQQPQDIYYSVAKYLNPQRVGQKGEDNPHFLHADLVFDIDNSDLSQALVDTRQVLRYGDIQGWELKYIAFSGSKGFHIIYQDPDLETIEKIPLPDEREKNTKNHREILVKKMKQEEINFDFKVTTDTRRIIRLPYSVHGRTRNVCTPFEKERIYNESINSLLTGIQKLRSNSVWNRIKRKLFGNDKTVSQLQAIRRSWNRLEFRSISRNTSVFYYSTFLTNRVPKSEMQIPIIELQYYNEEEKKALQELLKTYKLPQFLVSKIGNVHYAICFKPVQTRRLSKILKASNTKNLTHFDKFGFVLFEIGPRIYNDETKVSLHIINNLVNDSYHSTSHPLSFGHCKFFNFNNIFKIETPKPVTWVGGKEVEVRYSLIEDQL